MIIYKTDEHAVYLKSDVREITMQTAHAEYVTSASGRKKAVILPIKEYNRLLEDLHDLSVVAERHEEYPVSLAEMKQRLADHAVV